MAKTVIVMVLTLTFQGGFSLPCYVILIDVFFCKVHSIGLINKCTNFEINRLTILENLQKLYVFFDITYM